MDASSKKKILVIHPQLKKIGGAEQFALRLIDLLIAECNVHVTILTLEYVELSHLSMNGIFNFSADSISIQIAYCPRWLANQTDRFHLLRIGYLHRAAKKHAPNYDLCISTYNEIDFGRKGFQYIHHPNFAPRKFLHSFEITSTKNIFDSIPLFETLYRRIILLISRNTLDGIRMNTTCVVSLFMHDIIRELYQINARVVYPSFLTIKENQGGEVWDRRRFQFLSVGRIAPDKNFIELLELYKSLSIKFPEANFFIVGRNTNNDYFNLLKQKAKELNLQVNILTDINHDDLNGLLKNSKFYIGPKHFEHYGNTTFEAAWAGCLTLVHDSGGQTEIITPSILRYKSVQDLVQRVSELIADESLRKNILDQVHNHLKELTPEQFNQKILAVIGPLIRDDLK